MTIQRVATATLNQTPLDWDENIRHIVTCIDAARANRVNYLCFPEMSITGYGCEDAFLSPALQERSLQMLESLLPHTRDIFVAIGLPIACCHALFNGVAVLCDRQIVGFVAKKNLARDGVHYEPRWFSPWREGQVDTICIADKTLPIGDVLFEREGIRIGFEICEDAWVAGRPGVNLAANNVDIIMNPSASHFSFDKHQVRKSFVVEGSRAFSCTYMYSNMVGNEAGRIIYDGGSMIAQAGDLLAENPRFSFDDTHLTWADVDIDQARMRGAQKVPQRHTGNTMTIIPVHGSSMAPQDCRHRSSAPPCPPLSKAEEFSKAVSLGLWDYLRKTRSKGFVVSLSGGCDSATVAVLIRMMVVYALSELGTNRFPQRLPHIHFDDLHPDKVVHTLLTCVYQATRNSGDITRNAARKLADTLGAGFMMWDVDTQVTRYTEMVSSALGRDLTWEDDDLALQNIQARTRAPGVWLLANVKNALLLSTSNRSEAAVGYATMDGDTSGGLAPLAGIDKAYLLRWLKQVETEGLPIVGSIPALEAITAQSPTAELRPGLQQTDEDDLMPYPVLDTIETLAIRDRKAPIQVFTQLRAETSYPPDTLKCWITRFFQLWSRNQWKRERYAPSFQLDDKNLDPKTWCRFPILNSGFKKELDEMNTP